MRCAVVTRVELERRRLIHVGEAKQAADGIAQWLLDRGLSGADSVMVLSANSVEHALMRLGCYTAGVPIAPIAAGLFGAGLQSEGGGGERKAQHGQQHRDRAPEQHRLDRARLHCGGSAT